MLVVIKGAGDLATGIAHRLKMAGFGIVMTEIAKPTVVRHTVAFASAVYTKGICVEGVTAVLCTTVEEVYKVLETGDIPVIVDEKAKIIEKLQPEVVVDAIIAKRNVGTRLTDGQTVIGVGPGFLAGVDCHYVIETKRGHDLGKVITMGSAIPNTGIPGDIGGYTKERIIRAPQAGYFRAAKKIGETVKPTDIVAYVGDEPVLANIEGIVRGMLMDELIVPEGFKCGDIDPRCVKEHCFSISDKARSIGGGVLEAIMRGGMRDE